MSGCITCGCPTGRRQCTECAMLERVDEEFEAERQKDNTSEDDDSEATGVTLGVDVDGRDADVRTDDGPNADVSDSGNARLPREIAQRPRQQGKGDVVGEGKNASGGHCRASGDNCDQRWGRVPLIFPVSKQRRRMEKSNVINHVEYFRGRKSSGDTLRTDGGQPSNAVVQGLILPCRACGRIRKVDEGGHCPECARAEQHLVADGGGQHE
jgi:hypothetical protein